MVTRRSRSWTPAYGSSSIVVASPYAIDPDCGSGRGQGVGANGEELGDGGVAAPTIPDDHRSRPLSTR
jgi:hypothetical protein